MKETTVIPSPARPAADHVFCPVCGSSSSTTAEQFAEELAAALRSELFDPPEAE